MSNVTYSGLSRSMGGREQVVATMEKLDDAGSFEVLKMIAAMTEAQAVAVQAYFSAVTGGVVSSPGEGEVSAGSEASVPTDPGSQVSVNSSVSSARARKRARAKAAKQRAASGDSRSSVVTYAASEILDDTDGLCYLTLIDSAYQRVVRDMLGYCPTFNQLLRLDVVMFRVDWAYMRVSRSKLAHYHVSATGSIDAYSCFASIAGSTTGWPEGSMGDACKAGFSSLPSLLIEKRPLLTDVVGIGANCGCHECRRQVAIRTLGRTFAGTGAYDKGLNLMDEMKVAKTWFSPTHSECPFVEIVGSACGAGVRGQKVEEFGASDTMSKVIFGAYDNKGVYCFNACAWAVGVPPRQELVTVGDVDVLPSSQPLVVLGRGLARVKGTVGGHVFLRVMPSLKRFVHTAESCAVASTGAVLRNKLMPDYIYRPSLARALVDTKCDGTLKAVADVLDVGDTYQLPKDVDCVVPLGAFGTALFAESSFTCEVFGFRMHADRVLVCAQDARDFGLCVDTRDVCAAVGDDAYVIEDGGPSDDDDSKYDDVLG